MLTETTIYFITRLDDVKAVFHGTAIVSGILVLVSSFGVLILLSDAETNPNVITDNWNKLMKWWKSVRLTCFVLFIVFLVAYALTPTTKEMAAIKVIPAIVNSRDIQEIGQDFKVLAKEWLNELRPEKSFPFDKDNEKSVEKR